MLTRAALLAGHDTETSREEEVAPVVPPPRQRQNAAREEQKQRLRSLDLSHEHAYFLLVLCRTLSSGRGIITSILRSVRQLFLN